MRIAKPRPEDLIQAIDKTVPDLIDHRLKVLFCGINPSLYTAAVGHHFARPGNRFWPTLHAAGFTPRRLTAFEEYELLEYGYGITNLAGRATRAADELAKKELEEGARILEYKAEIYKPEYIAVLGIGAYRTAFGKKKAGFGLQEERIADAKVWVLPNTSGLNAHYTLPTLAEVYTELREAAG